jgi:hypothetical protein
MILPSACSSACIVPVPRLDGAQLGKMQQWQPRERLERRKGQTDSRYDSTTIPKFQHHVNPATESCQDDNTAGSYPRHRHMQESPSILPVYWLRPPSPPTGHSVSRAFYGLRAVRCNQRRYTPKYHVPAGPTPAYSHGHSCQAPPSLYHQNHF